MPLPSWPGRSVDEFASRLDGECDWLIANDVVNVEVVTRNRRLAEIALRQWKPMFIHGDLQLDHLFIDGEEVTGVIDWSEASQGRRAVRPRHPHTRIPRAPRRDLIRVWWSLRCVSNVRWLSEHGFGPSEEMPEVAVLIRQM